MNIASQWAELVNSTAPTIIRYAATGIACTLALASMAVVYGLITDRGAELHEYLAPAWMLTGAGCALYVAGVI